VPESLETGGAERQLAARGQAKENALAGRI
jgi:hypothetical protein